METDHLYSDFKYVINLIICLILFNLSLTAQWQTDARLTIDPAASYTTGNNARTIASSGSFIHIAWADNRNGGDFEIYYKHSIDNGMTWTADTRLTNSVGFSYNPSIGVSGQSIHLVWYDNRDGNYKIYYKRSTDGGISWGSDIKLTNESTRSEFPSLAVSDQIVHVVWEDKRNQNEDPDNIEIYYKRSIDGGVTWGQDMRFTNDTNGSNTPSISLSSQIVHIVWSDVRGNGKRIYYKNSSNDGSSWGNEIMLTTGTFGSFDPSISAMGQNIAIAWNDMRALNGYFEIYGKWSTDGGNSWSVDTRLTDAPLPSVYPSVAVSGQNIHISWCDDRFDNAEILYKQSTDMGTSWSQDIRLTNSPGLSEGASLSLSDSNIFLAWYDHRDGNFEIYFKKNPNGNITEITHIHTEIPNVYKLKQNYPNPFNPSTKIQFSVPQQRDIILTVYDITGRIIESVINYETKVGNYEYVFNSKNLASGIYYYSLYSDGLLIDTKKMVLLK